MKKPSSIARWSRHARLGAAIAGAAVVLLIAAGLALSRGAREPVRASLTLAEALGAGDTLGFERAYAARAFEFPADHGPHTRFRTEWWYFTGNLEAEDGTLLGYELTFFRSALRPPGAEEAGAANGETIAEGNEISDHRPSAWAADHAFMAHFAVTDAGEQRFVAHERFAREAAGLAGAAGPPFRVWLGDWFVRSAAAEDDVSSKRVAAAEGDIFPLRLRAAEGDVAVDLRLERGKHAVLNGDRGLSRKGPEPGNASYYYSLTRMPTTGTVRVGGRTFPVSGSSWMDREWSTSGLGPDLAGWDWFALQLSDGSELMLYRLRRQDGSASPFSGGTLVGPSGSSRALAEGDVAVDVLDRWASPRDGARYPAAWRIRVPAEGLDVRVIPLMADQELNLAVRYWEGAALVEGRREGARIEGRAYVELTGYAGRLGTRAGRAAPPVSSR